MASCNAAGEYGNVQLQSADECHRCCACRPSPWRSARKVWLLSTTLTADNRVAYRSIKISRDLGGMVEVASGLSRQSDRIIDNPARLRWKTAIEVHVGAQCTGHAAVRTRRPKPTEIRKFQQERIAIAAAALFLGGCSLAPIYRPPNIAISSDAWKDNPWQAAKPADDLPHGSWWRIYDDPTLNTLESQIEQANPDLRVALARYDQANAYTDQLRSQLLPSVDAGTSFSAKSPIRQPPLRGADQPDVYGADTVRSQRQLRAGLVGTGAQPGRRGAGLRRRPAPPTWKASGSARKRNWRTIMCACAASMRKPNYSAMR